MPGRKIDLLPSSSDGMLDKGLKFILLATEGDGDKGARTEGGEDDESISDAEEEGAGGGGVSSSKNKRRGEQRSTEELSGGQMALLGLSFVFAAALHKRSPLYLLDEVMRASHTHTHM